MGFFMEQYIYMSLPNGYEDLPCDGHCKTSSTVDWRWRAPEKPDSNKERNSNPITETVATNIPLTSNFASDQNCRFVADNFCFTTIWTKGAIIFYREGGAPVCDHGSSIYLPHLLHVATKKFPIKIDSSLHSSPKEVHMKTILIFWSPQVTDPNLWSF